MPLYRLSSPLTGFPYASLFVSFRCYRLFNARMLCLMPYDVVIEYSSRLWSVPHMGIIACIFMSVFAFLLMKIMLHGIFSSIASLFVKSDEDAEALEFVIGCVRSKLIGAPMPDTPSYIGASAQTGRQSGRAKRPAR